MTGLEVDFQICCEIRQIVGVASAPIPQHGKYARRGWGALSGAVDGFLTGRGIPCINRIFGMCVEVGAIQILHGANVVEAKGLKLLVIASAAANDSRSVAHDCIVLRRLVERHDAAKLGAGLEGMAEP